MKKNANLVVALTGVALTVGFFLPIIDIGGLVRASGWDIVTSDGLSPWTRLAWLLLPAGGLAMAGAGLTGSKAARGISLGVGVGILGYAAWQTIRVFFATTGVGLWLILVGAIVAVVAGFASRK